MDCQARVDVTMSISMLAYKEEDKVICKRMSSFQLLEINLVQHENF